MRSRQERKMEPIRKDIKDHFLAYPTPETAKSEKLNAEQRIRDYWMFLKNTPAELTEMFEIPKKIRTFEILSAMSSGGGEAKKRAELAIAALRRRSDYLWSMFYQTTVKDVDAMLSARNQANTFARCVVQQKGGASWE